MGNNVVKMVDIVEQGKQEIIQRAGNLDEVEIMHNQVLIGIWKRPEKTKGGIILTDNTRKEDDYQGKVGLVLKLGPGAFEDTEDMAFAVKPKVGDWVVLRPGDGWQLRVNEQECRMPVDVSIKMVIARPEIVY